MSRAITLEEGWNQLNGGITKLFQVVQDGLRTPYSNEEFVRLYTKVYDMCTQSQNLTQDLYQKYKETLNQYCSNTILTAVRRHRAERLLEELYHRWEEYKLVTKVLAGIFYYLDRFYTQRDKYTVSRGEQPVPLKELAETIFKQHLFDEIKGEVKDIILQFIHREREGELIDRNMLKSAVEVYIVMGGGKLTLYEADFERDFLRTTAEYYRLLSSTWIQNDSCPEYLEKTEDRLAAEMLRVEHYLHPSTESKLTGILNQELLANHIHHLVEMENSGAIALLIAHRKDDLSRMFRMVSRLDDKDGIVPMSVHLRHHITSIGLDAVRDQERVKPKDVFPFLDALLQIQDKYEDLVTSCFENNQQFVKAMNEAFTEFINKQTRKNTTAELISYYIDSFMKKQASELPEDVVEARFDKIVKLFQHVVEKDLFQEFYRKQLAKRLLMSKALNEEAEKSFILKLKLHHGASFTTRLEGMFTDHTMASELQNEFSDYVREHPIPIDLSVQVLTQGYWPTYKIDEVTLPEVMTQSMEVFKEFYLGMKRNRRIIWVPSLGTAVLNARFEKRSSELTVTTYQAVVLLLFNGGRQLSARDVQQATNLPPEEVKRALLSLATQPKYLILTKHSEGEEYEPDTQFSFNRGWEGPRKVRIPGIAAVSEKEVGDIGSHVMQDRKLVTEAVIVRIMKSRQRLTHQELISEVISQLKHFKPEAKMIKARVEDLINRLYLKRDESQHNLYHYLA